MACGSEKFSSHAEKTKLVSYAGGTLARFCCQGRKQKLTALLSLAAFIATEHLTVHSF